MQCLITVQLEQPRFIGALSTLRYILPANPIPMLRHLSHQATYRMILISRWAKVEGFSMQLALSLKLIAKFKYPLKGSKTCCQGRVALGLRVGLAPLGTRLVRNRGQFDLLPNRRHQSHYRPTYSDTNISLLWKKRTNMRTDEQLSCSFGSTVRIRTS